MKHEDVRATAWLAIMHTDHGDVPFRFTRTNDTFTIVNGEERIVLEKSAVQNDTAWFTFPHYGGTISFVQQDAVHITGQWHRDCGTIRLPFTAQPASRAKVAHNPSAFFEVVFRPKEPNSWNAVGQFQLGDEYAGGTFLTPTGDYRYLEGLTTRDGFWLTKFDGRYLYLFDASFSGDSILGTFMSTNNPPMTWVGRPKTNGSELGAIKQSPLVENQPMQFSASRWNGEEVEFNEEYFKDKVTIVTLFGSWCPNCHDELRFLTELRFENAFEVIPVAFEYDTELAVCEAKIKRLFQNFNIPFASYYGGPAQKSFATERFPMIQSVDAYPTTMFIDKKGRLRYATSGFTGPGTAELYQQYTSGIAAIVAELTAE